MTSDTAAVADVAIVGGGFSGTMAAAQLARRGLSSILIEGEAGRLGRGIAYSTDEPAHLLNVTAQVMSAWPEDLEDFSRQVKADGGEATDYVERRRFGRYMDEQLEQAIATGLVRTLNATAVSARRRAGLWAIGLEGGSEFRSRALVLAIGNQQPANLPAADGLSESRYVGNPWADEARAAIHELAGADKSILIIGTSLTAIDLILSLDAAGYRGAITALSRRGQLPRAHMPYEPAPIERKELPLGNVLNLWRWLRRRAAEGSWRAAIDAIRPHSSAIWEAFGEQEQRRFLRHAWPWWSVHRHRIAPQVAERVKQLIGSGQLEVAAGRIRSMRETGDGVEVEIDRKGSDEAFARRFDMVFNCTGPRSVARTASPVLKQMIADGLVAPDLLGIGLAVDGNDRAGEMIWAMGPMTKGRYWEIIAVPDIRGQAAAVAADIEAELTE